VEEIRRRFLINLLKVFDLVLVALSFGVAAILAAYSDNRVSIEEFFSIRVKLSNCVIFVVFLLVWHCLLRSYGLYRSKRVPTREADILEAMKAIALSTACLGAGAVLFHIRMVTPRFLILFWSFGTVFVAVSRIALRETLDQILQRGGNLKYVLIVGTNSRAMEFARRIRTEPERGYRVLGFADYDWPMMSEFEKTGFPLVCGIEGLPEFLRRNVVDEVAMYLPLRSNYERASKVAELCEQNGILVRFDGDIFSLKKSHYRAEEFAGRPYVTVSNAAREWWSLTIKRSLDILFSLVFLILFSPVFLAAAVAIFFTSEGPIFYLQERVGLNKRRFRMYKFRTMLPNAEKMMDQLERLNEASGPVFKIKNDPRITRVGKILRRTSVDELPQLLNVLRGDMSLVGPRPLPVRDYEGFSEDWQRRRFSVRPGITCLWQIAGRNSIPFEQWMRLDLQYVDEWSLWLDLKILARTIPAVLKGVGAT
jgi:exopolysaccharide biosynthesis polyprenyl glycosylphosphotransferase